MPTVLQSEAERKVVLSDNNNMLGLMQLQNRMVQ